MNVSDRVGVLLASVARASGIVAEQTGFRVADVAPWMGRDALVLWLKLIKQHRAGNKVDPREASELMRAVRNAYRFKRAGVSAHERYPREELRRLRWHRWAERNGVPMFEPENSARPEPTRLAPWMRD